MWHMSTKCIIVNKHLYTVNINVKHMYTCLVHISGLKCPTTDQFILRFLRARKFDYEKAYNMILNYYHIRAEYSESCCMLFHSQTYEPSENEE